MARNRGDGGISAAERLEDTSTGGCGRTTSAHSRRSGPDYPERPSSAAPSRWLAASADIPLGSPSEPRRARGDQSRASGGGVPSPSRAASIAHPRRCPARSRETAAAVRTERGARNAALALARRARSAKLASNRRLRAVVEALLELRWSPQQIAWQLRQDHPDEPEMRVSHETIYQSLFVQGRGALRAELTALPADRAGPAPTGTAAARPRRDPPTWSSSASGRPRSRTAPCPGTGRAT